MANELGRLTQGVGTRMKQGKNNLIYISWSYNMVKQMGTTSTLEDFEFCEVSRLLNIFHIF